MLQLSRIDLGASSAASNYLPFEAFAVLRETVVIAQRSKDSVTFSQAYSFDRIRPDNMQFGSRERAFLLQEPDGKFRVEGEQSSMGRPPGCEWNGRVAGRPPRPPMSPAHQPVTSFTMIALPRALESERRAIAVTDDVSTRTLLQTTPVSCAVNLIGTKDVSGYTTIYVLRGRIRVAICQTGGISHWQGVVADSFAECRLDHLC
jgi:hypothetical protein